MILKDQDDLDLIEDLCLFFFVNFECELFFDCIENHLKDRINIENFETISKIAFVYKIDGLIKSLNEFNERNFNRMSAKSYSGTYIWTDSWTDCCNIGQLSENIRSSDESLLSITLKFLRKPFKTMCCLRKS